LPILDHQSKAVFLDNFSARLTFLMSIFYLKNKEMFEISTIDAYF